MVCCGGEMFKDTILIFLSNYESTKVFLNTFGNFNFPFFCIKGMLVPVLSKRRCVDCSRLCKSYFVQTELT